MSVCKKSYLTRLLDESLKKSVGEDRTKTEMYVLG